MQEIEFAILDGIQALLRCETLDVLMKAASRLADHGEVWMILALVLLMNRSQRRSGKAMLWGMALEFVSCNLLLKPLVGRARPFTVNTMTELLVAPPTDGSFPSGHTAVSFAAAFALMASGNGLWKPAMALASVIAFSRLYLYVHWPTDVLGGVLLGAVTGWLGSVLRQLSAPGWV